MSLVGALLIVVMAAALGRADRRRWGTVTTPGVLLMSGYAVVAVVVAVARWFYPFAPVHVETYLFIIGFGLFCSLVSHTVAAITRWRPAELDSPTPDVTALARGMLVGAVVLFVPLAVRALNVGGQELWSSDSKDALGHGPVGHLHIALGYLVVWYATASRDKRRLRYPLLGVSCVALTLYPVKGWTLIPVTGVILARMVRARRLERTAGYVGGLALIGFAVFFGIYWARASGNSSDRDLIRDVGPAIFEHFIFYLTSGFMGFNAVVGGLQLDGGPTALFAPFVNAWSAAIGTGRYLDIVSRAYVDSMPAHSALVNVYSILGTLTGHTNPVTGTALAGAILAVVYLLFVVSWRTGSSALRAAAMYQCAVLFFGWFDYYYWLLPPYEVLALAIALSAVAKRLTPPAGIT